MTMLLIIGCSPESVISKSENPANGVKIQESKSVKSVPDAAEKQLEVTTLQTLR
jgi:hypothetical protein